MNLEVNTENYPILASKTESLDLEIIKDRVLSDIEEVGNTLEMIVDIGKIISMKKAELFYGKKNEIESFFDHIMHTGSDKIDTKKITSSNIRILHACLGLVSEGAEMTECLKKSLVTGSPLDEINIVEEAGDILWYLAIIANVFGISFKEMMDKNIRKLAKRYGEEKFSSERALKRSLDEERKELEK